MRLLRVPKRQKDRVLLGLTYDTGMRLFEVQGLHIADVDYERSTVHVRSGKYGRGRYIFICDDILRGIEDYIKTDKPVEYLFDGRQKAVLFHAERYNGSCKEQYRHQGSRSLLHSIVCVTPMLRIFWRLPATYIV